MKSEAKAHALHSLRKYNCKQNMKCIKPTIFPNAGNIVNKCGQCMPCRITKRREWETKLNLEWQTWNCGAFVTLTYAPEHLPQKHYYKGGTLDKTHLQKFMKRFRKNFNETYGNRVIRYFGVGEYGDRSQRAHYHLVIFNAEANQIEYITKKSWKLGHSLTAELNKERINYTLGYTIKKMTSPNNFKDNRQAEFSLMSRKPPLGTYAIPKFAKAIKKRKLFPKRGFKLGESKELRNNWIRYGLKEWNGDYYDNNGKYYTLNTYLLRKIVAIAYPEIMKLININLNEEITIRDMKELKAFSEHLGDRTILDKIKFEGSEEQDETKKKAESIARKTYEKKTL